jgi:hypothetical protein
LTEQQNIADMAASTLAAIDRMDEGLDANHPERDAILNLKRAAEQAVIDGLRGALAIADAARSVRNAVTEVKIDAVNQAAQSGA